MGCDQLLVLVAPGHPWAQRRRLNAGDLQAAAWVLRERGSGTRASFEAELVRAGVELEAMAVAITLPSNEAVAGGGGRGAQAPRRVSESVASGHLGRGELARAPFALPKRAYQLLYHRDRYQSRAAQAFARLAQQAG